MSLALLGLPFAADDVAARELPPAGARWIELRSANFTFTSNTGTSATRRIALDLEELRSALAGLTDFELRSPVPTSIFIFKSDRSFTPYKTLYRGRPADIAGYFLGRDHGNYIAIEAGSRRASEIMYHEYVHFVMDTNLWFLPPWLAEGLAEFYQTFEVSGDRVSIGLPGWSHVQRLQGRTLIPFAELIEVDYDSPLYNEAVRKSDFYAQAWAVTHYLLLGSRDRRAQLDHCLGLLRAGIDPVEAVNRAFGDDLQALDGEVRRHIRGPAMPSLRTTRELEYDTSLQARELSRAELLYRLGDLLSAQRSRRDESLRHFEAAIEADPDHGRTWSALALMAEERADWSSARSAHARAVEASPNDPVLLYRWGRYLERRSDDSAEAVRVLRRAAEIDPSFAPAWKALSTIYADLGTTSREALQAAVTAHRLLPSDAVAADTLVRLCLRIDDRQCAVDVIATSTAPAS